MNWGKRLARVFLGGKAEGTPGEGVFGRTSNEWVDWKDKDGRTLHDVKRAGDDET